MTIQKCYFFPNTRYTQQLKLDKYIFIFHRLIVVLSLQKGAYPENSHIFFIVILKLVSFYSFMCLYLIQIAVYRWYLVLVLFVKIDIWKSRKHNREFCLNVSARQSVSMTTRPECVAKVSITSRAELFGPSLMKSGSIRLRSDELKFEAKHKSKNCTTEMFARKNCVIYQTRTKLKFLNLINAPRNKYI